MTRYELNAACRALPLEPALHAGLPARRWVRCEWDATFTHRRGSARAIPAEWYDFLVESNQGSTEDKHVRKTSARQNGDPAYRDLHERGRDGLDRSKV